MKYFIDTEFIEGTQSKTFCGIKHVETKPTIDLISIGIVSEDGREYYAISKDFNLKEAWNRYDLKKDFGKPQGLGDIKKYWLRENVLKPIYYELMFRDSTKINDEYFTYYTFKRLINKYGKSNKQIAEEIKEFCSDKIMVGNTEFIGYGVYKFKDIQFYGYYSDYDWVAFCWLFGKMIDLPKGFPMYCIDLKQILDEKAKIKSNEWGTIKDGVNCFDMQNHIKTLPNYPKQTNEHNALSDAKWNFKLYEFLKSL